MKGDRTDPARATIFVSIASYRDQDCSRTLTNLYETAEYPERVSVGICQQNKLHMPGESCLPADIGARQKSDALSHAYKNGRIRLISLENTAAKGPTWARYLCATLWRGERYYFQIDSHTRFRPGWDRLCIEMIHQARRDNGATKPVISHYPKTKQQYEHGDDAHSAVPRICTAFFNERGMLSFNGAEELPTHGKLVNVPFLASGMFFCEASFLQELPYDPDLPYLFVGEEILHSARFYTHGWDIFTPSQNVVYHEYTRQGQPKIWDDLKYSDELAHRKVKTLLGLMKPSGDISVGANGSSYGLGAVRTLQEFYHFSGINVAKKTVKRNFCRPHIGLQEDDYRYAIYWICLMWLIILTLSGCLLLYKYSI